MVACNGRLALRALGLIGMLVPASAAMGQGNTFNPYGNSGYADYREFGNPMYSNNPSLPGQSRLNEQPIISRSRANSFQQYTDGLDGRDPGGAGSSVRGSTVGVPYYQSFRRYDKEFNRVYRPNVEADKGFDDRVKRRDEAYAKALEEKDPVKRARILRQLEQDSLDRPVPKARTTAKAATAPAPRAAGSTPAPAATRAPNSGTGAAARRTPAAPSTTPGRAPAPGTRAPTATRAPAPSPRGGPSMGPAPDPSTIPVPPPPLTGKSPRETGPGRPFDGRPGPAYNRPRETSEGWKVRPGAPLRSADSGV